jgi:Fanconi anemia group M protein
MIKIHVDHREVQSGIPTALEELGAEVIIEALGIGDYHVSNDVIIERKTTTDFLHSILDDPGHLYGQLADMMREYKRSLLLIEGAPMDLYTDRAIHPNAIDGMAMTMPQRQIYVVSAIGEGVGVVVAEDLLKHFRSVRAVMNASIEELMEVKGVGQKIAEKVREIVGGEYKNGK